MKKSAIAFSLTVAFAFLLAFAAPWYYSILVHGFPCFVMVEPISAIWIPESFLIAFALIYIGRAIIHISKPKDDEKEGDSG